MTKPPSGDKSKAADQHARFLETARALGCDESEEAFDEKLKVIARHKPKPSAPEPEPKSPDKGRC